MNVALAALVSPLPEGLAGKMLRDLCIGKAETVEDMRWIEVGPCLQHQYPLSIARPIGQIVGQDAAANPGPDNDNVEVVARPKVLREQPRLRRLFLRDEILVGASCKGHVSVSRERRGATFMRASHSRHPLLQGFWRR